MLFFLSDLCGLCVLQANRFTLSPFIDNRCNTFNVEDMLRCARC